MLRPHPGLRTACVAAFIFALAASLDPVDVEAQWRFGGVPVCSASHNQVYPFAVADGAGGVFIGWADLRDSVTNDSDVYLQHLNSDGVPLWTPGGVPVCTAPGLQSEPHLVLDGQGGVIATWSDIRNNLFSDIYAQRVSATGTPVWAGGGIRLSTSTDDKFLNFCDRPCIASDGAGGAIITWDERLTGFDTNIWAQRIGPSGTLLWSSRGRRVSGAVGFQTFTTLVSDGRGGAFITWEDWRETPNVQVFAQRVSNSGAPYWEPNGIRISPVEGRGALPIMVRDGAMGAYIAFHDGWKIFLQRVGANGILWTEGGASICSAPSNRSYTGLTLASDGAAVVSWDDRRPNEFCMSSCDPSVYSQKVDSTGATMWQTDGVSVCTFPGYQGRGAAISDGAGGVIISWGDPRPGAEGQYVQHLDASGTPQWADNGVPISSDPSGATVIVSDGVGGAIVVWSDNRDGIFDEFGEAQNMDIFAARVTTSGGNVDVPRPFPPNFRLLPARPNPTRSETTIPFDLPSVHKVDLEIFSPSGQRVRSLARSQIFAAGRHELSWNGTGDAGRPVPSGVYFVRLTVGGQSVVGRISLLR